MREASRVSIAATSSALAVLAALAVSTGCAPHMVSAAVPMTWLPTSPMNVNAFAGDSTQSTVYIGAVTDRRGRKQQVGENVEESAPRPIYSKGDPMTFVRDATRLLFQRGGVQVVDSDASAERIVTVDLNTFWARESDVYMSDISATYYVKDRSGKELWKGTVSGTAKTWGRSLSAENYQQVFSDGTLKMIEGLLSNAGFREALKASAGQAAGTTP
jgi:hypothetical protein